MREYTAIVKQDGELFFNWTADAQIDNLSLHAGLAILVWDRVEEEEALEANRADARSAASEHFEEVRIAV